jgi:hypothetical protein
VAGHINKADQNATIIEPLSISLVSQVFLSFLGVLPPHRFPHMLRSHLFLQPELESPALVSQSCHSNKRLIRRNFWHDHPPRLNVLYHRCDHGGRSVSLLFQLCESKNSRFSQADQISLQYDLSDELPEAIKGIFSDQIGLQIEATMRLRKLLSQVHDPPFGALIESSVTIRVVELLRSPHSLIQFEAAWALTNIVASSDQQTRVAVEAGAIPILVELLNSHDADIQDQAVWGLANIGGNDSKCRDNVLSAGALQPLLKLVSDARKLGMLRSATWALSNLCRGKTPPPNWLTVRIS